MYDRESALKKAFNRAVVDLLGIEERDYYSKLTTNQMLSLKRALSDINNIITLRLAYALAGWICDNFSISKAGRKAILDTIRSSKPNANGYDIELTAPDCIAEIKCNIPINAGSVYGAAQRNGLQRDIQGLLEGKSKSPKKVENSVKLLGLYDTPEVRAATEHFVKNLPATLKQKVVVEPQRGESFDNQHVYVVFVK